MDSGVPASSGDQLNSVVFANSVFGQPFGANTVAVTYYRYSGSTMHEADILFNRIYTFDSYRGPLQFPGPGLPIMDIRRVFLHELGHGLGLGHPDASGQQVVAIMNSLMSNLDVLSADDIAVDTPYTARLQARQRPLLRRHPHLPARVTSRISPRE